MAQLPDCVTLLMDDAGEEFDPGVIASEMEKGLAKLRVGQSRVIKRLPVTMLFDSAADAERFEEWYFGTIKRIGWFEIQDPRTQTMRSVRFVGGQLGKLVPTLAGYAQSKRDATLEYLR